MEDFSVGMEVSYGKIIIEVDILFFFGVLGDINLVYLDEDFVLLMMFKGCIVYGMLIVSLILMVLGMKLLGFGVIYLS